MLAAGTLQPLGHGILGAAGDPGVGRATPHPFLQEGNLRGWQFFLGHADVLMGMAHGLDEQAARHIARQHGGAVLTTGLPAAARIQHQATAGFLRRVAMALEAAALEEWQDPLFEESLVLALHWEGAQR